MSVGCLCSGIMNVSKGGEYGKRAVGGWRWVPGQQLQQTAPLCGWQARPVGSTMPKYLHNEPGMEVWGSQTCLLPCSMAWITKHSRGIQRYLQNQHIQDFEEGSKALWRPGQVVTLVSPVKISQGWFLFQFLVGHFCLFYCYCPVNKDVLTFHGNMPQ